MLNPNHSRGRHKARVFMSVLGLGAFEAEELRAALLDAAHLHDAEPTAQDEHGQRFVIEFQLTLGTRRATIHSGWIVRTGEDYPRLTTCYIA